MEISNTEEEYGLLAKFFHWTIAVLILGLLPIGLFMGGMENSPAKFQIFALHKSFGLTVFFLGLGRILWRFISPPPDHLETHARWELTLASAAHFWLYVCIIGMPLSGWLMSSAGEFPIPFFGLQMPALMGKNEQLAELFGETHEILAYTLLFVLGLHIAGALKHHVLDKDKTLMRMAWYKEGVLLPALVILIAGASFAVSGLLIGREVLERDGDEEVAVQTASQTKVTSAVVAADTASLPEHGWAIVKADSKLEFQATLYNAPFTGTFGDFSGTIIFDPNDLTTAMADIRIGMKDVETGDKERNDSIKGADWFDSENFPDSRFVSKKFEKADGNNYVAVGDVTIRGVTMPLIIPFALDISGNKAHMTAKFSLDRTLFGMGQGQWDDESTVGHNVDIAIDLTAVQ